MKGVSEAIIAIEIGGAPHNNIYYYFRMQGGFCRRVLPRVPILPTPRSYTVTHVMMFRLSKPPTSIFYFRSKKKKPPGLCLMTIYFFTLRQCSELHSYWL